MDKKNKIDYASAGVSLHAADEAVKRIKSLAGNTFTENVLSDIGSFGGLFRLPLKEYSEPVLVSSTDSVGTKLKLAFMSGIHSTVGQDIVNHCVNDILVQGARPLFFMDYIGVGRLDPNVLAEVVSGLAAACKENGMALLGGETAELPGFYSEGEYDLVGTIVGIVDRENIIDGSTIVDGDGVIGLPSTGLHTNGYSLARKICFEVAKLKFDDRVDPVGEPIGQALMKVHKSYLGPVTKLLGSIPVHGMAHITGGGIPGNLVRIIPDGLQAGIEKRTWPTLPIFDYLQNAGGVDDNDMFDAFNMGIGYIVVVGKSDVDAAEKFLAEHGQPSYRIGLIRSGDRGVRIT